MAPTDDALDMQQLLAAFGEIDDDVREMMQLFVETTAPILDELEAHAAVRDRTAVEDVAHSAKGLRAAPGPGAGSGLRGAGDGGKSRRLDGGRAQALPGQARLRDGQTRDRPAIGSFGVPPCRRR